MFRVESSSDIEKYVRKEERYEMHAFHSLFLEGQDRWPDNDPSLMQALFLASYLSSCDSGTHRLALHLGRGRCGLRQGLRTGSALLAHHEALLRSLPGAPAPGPDREPALHLQALDIDEAGVAGPLLDLRAEDHHLSALGTQRELLLRRRGLPEPEVLTANQDLSLLNLLKYRDRLRRRSAAHDG